MTTALLQFISVLARYIVAACDPDELLLFGSYAKGLQNRYSDIDLLAVLDRPVTAALRNEICDATACVPLPVDVHVHTRQELAQLTSDPYGFYASILISARSLYRRPGVLSIIAWCDRPPTKALAPLDEQPRTAVNLKLGRT